MPSWFSAWLAYFASLVAAYTHGQPVPSAPMPITSPVAIVTAAPAPRDNDGPGHREIPDGDGPTASPQAWPSPVVWPSSVPASDAPSAAPVPSVSDVPAPVGSPSFTPSAAPSQSPAPVPRDTPLALSCSAGAPGGMPPLSACFTGNSIAHHSWAALVASGTVTMQSQTLADNYWAPGASGAAGDGPVYVVDQTTPAVSGTMRCSDGGNGCGMEMRLPRGFGVQTDDSDKHVASMDIAHGYEMDVWGGGGWPNVHAVGYYPLSGDGLLPGGRGGWTGIAGAESVPLITILTGDLDGAKLSRPIGHALGFVSKCVGPGSGVYPDLGKNPDATCSAPSPVYGALIHLKASYDISADPHARNPSCRAELDALARFGAFTADTQGGGDTGRVKVFTESPLTAGPVIADDPDIRNGVCFSAIPPSAIEVGYALHPERMPADHGYGSPQN